MTRVLASLLIAALLSIAAPTEARDKKLTEQVKSAVAILYSQDGSGGMRMHCTVTAFERLMREDPSTKINTVVGYRFATAAHCIGKDDTTKEKSADTKQTPFFITFDESGTKRFWPAKPIFVGYQSRGEDVAEFEVVTNELWDTIPLGDEKKSKDGDEILNISVPMGLGKQVLMGNIASVYLDRPIVQGDINWKGSMTLALTGVNGGSSGSAVVSDEQKAIVAILVGTIGETTITAIPISRFKAVRKAVKEGKYKYYQPTTDLNPDGTAVE